MKSLTTHREVRPWLAFITIHVIALCLAWHAAEVMAKTYEDHLSPQGSHMRLIPLNPDLEI